MRLFVAFAAVCAVLAVSSSAGLLGEEKNVKGTDVRMPGGPLGVSADDEDVQNAVKAAMDSYNQQTNTVMRHVFVRLEKGTRQVVAGIKYDLNLVVAPSNCRNPWMQGGEKDTTPDKDCAFREAETKPLHVVVWWQAWNKAHPYNVKFPTS